MLVLAFLDMPAALNSDQYAAGMPQYAADMLFLSSELDRQGILYLLWVQSNGYDVQPLLEQYKRTWRNIRDVHPWMCKALRNLMQNVRDDGQPLGELNAQEGGTPAEEEDDPPADVEELHLHTEHSFPASTRWPVLLPLQLIPGFAKRAAAFEVSRNFGCRAR